MVENIKQVYITYFEGSPDMINIKTKIRLSEEQQLTYNCPADNKEKQPECARAWFQIEGITKIEVGQYEASVSKLDIFEWNEIIPLLKRAIEALMYPIEAVFVEKRGAADRPLEIAAGSDSANQKFLSLMQSSFPPEPGEQNEKEA